MRTVYYCIVLFQILIICSATESHARSDWEVRPSIVLSQSYDNNIYSQEDNIEDYVTRIGANLSAIYSGSNVNLLTNYSGTLNTYADHSGLNVLTHDASMKVDMERWLRRFLRDADITISENFRYTPELQDLNFNEDRGVRGAPGSSGLSTGRSDSYRNVFSVGLEHPVSQRQNVTIRYSNLLTEYSEPALIDNKTHSVFAGTSLMFLRDVLYGNIGVSTMSGDGVDTTGYSVTGGLRHPLSPVSALDTNLGVETLEYEMGSSTSVMRASLQFSRQFRYVTCNTGYTRELNPASGVSTIPTRSDFIYLNTGIRHSANLSSNIRANYSVNKSTRGSEIDTRSYNLSARVSYLFRPWLDGNVSVSHFNQSSETPGSLNIKREQITFQISIYPLSPH